MKEEKKINKNDQKTKKNYDIIANHMRDYCEMSREITGKNFFFLKKNG